MFKQELNLKMPTFVWLMIVLLSCWSRTVRANYTSVTVIGDSFSNGGSDKTAVVSYYKLFNRHFQDHLNPRTNQPYYFGKRFSNGHVAVEYLAYAEQVSFYDLGSVLETVQMTQIDTAFLIPLIAVFKHYVPTQKNICG